MFDLKQQEIGKSSKKIGIITIAYNEEKTIKKLIEEIQENIACEIIIVNDGSTDRTKIFVEDFTRNHKNVHLLNHIVNVGPATAIQTGLKYGLLMKCNYFVQVDGDGQHPPDQIKKVLEHVLKEEFDLVIGSRYLGKTEYKTSVTRRVGIWGTAKAVSTISGVKLTDVNSGFRAFNVKFAKKILKEYGSINTLYEFTLKICKEGYTVKEVPVSMNQRKFGKSYLSTRRLFMYPLRLVYNTIKSEL